jgi:hypothetical protein
MYCGRLVKAAWISANPRIKFNLLFWFVYFCMSVYFCKTSESKYSFDPNKISEETFRSQYKNWNLKTTLFVQ